jgi:GT2 family glycosyltransferase
VLREPTPGLSHARNRALAESDADWVAYLDDDAFVRDGWLGALRAAAGREGVALVGGPIEPRFERPPPRWFDRAQARRTFGPEGPLTGADVRLGFSGGNLAVRRDALDAVGGFDTGLGMVGAALGLGEETEMAARLADRFGNATYHAPGMAVDHLEPAPKQTPRYVARRAFVNGRQAWRYAGGGRGRRAAFSALKAAKQAAVGLAQVPLAVGRPARLHAALRGLATGAGALAGAFDVLVGRGGDRP